MKDIEPLIARDLLLMMRSHMFAIVAWGRYLDMKLIIDFFSEI